MSLKGGTKLRSVLSGMVKSAESADTVSVGFLEGATYPDGTSVPMVAAINEYGEPSRGQPPRPFFRRMISEKSSEWPSAIAGLLKQNDYDAGKTLAMVGEGVKGQLQQSIKDLDSPPLAQSTIDRKGFEKPLIDTSHMLNSVDYAVTKKDD